MICGEILNHDLWIGIDDTLTMEMFLLFGALTSRLYYQSLPPVVKTYELLCLITTIAYHLQLCNPSVLALFYGSALKRLQLWRLVTNFFFLGPFSFPFAVRLLVLARYGVFLEKGPFDRRTADFLQLMIFGALSLLVMAVVPFLWVPFMGVSLVFVLVYIWSLEFPNAHINIYGVVTLKGFYLPWAMLAFDFIFRDPLKPGILGMVVGHLYYIITLPHPLAEGRDILKTSLSVVMEGKEIIKEEEEPPHPLLIVAVAVSGSRKTKWIIKWALENVIPEGRISFKLLHVHARITAVPTPMGNSIPISQVRDDVAAAYKKEVEWRTNEMLLHYQQMCAQRKVQADVVVIESDDVTSTISGEVAKFNISKLVIGASSLSMFTRKFKGRNISSRISECTPNCCTVYVVSKDKLSSMRPSIPETIGSTEVERSDPSGSTNSCSNYTSCSSTDPGSPASYSYFRSPSQLIQRFQAVSTIKQTLLGKISTPSTTNYSRGLSLDIKDRSLQTDNGSWVSDQASTLDAPTDFSSSRSQVDINSELERMRIELTHFRGMYEIAQNEAINATQKMEEAVKLKEVIFKEEKDRELARQEKEKCDAAKKEAAYKRECVQREALQRKQVETEENHEAKEKEKLEKALMDPDQQYNMFTWEEIVSATSSFSNNLRIGMGAYGTVYKCNLHHTTVAVKVPSKERPWTKQFKQELEILSKIRHPHLLLLLGACPDHGCLVYEYMENGSLHERLFRKGNTTPIPWFKRYRIAWEVASALVFLHNSKPRPIIHCDLKPANILLDHNFVSKIGDVGLSTSLPLNHSLEATIYKDTVPVGTLCYIDPEYRRSRLVTPKSDVYAFGMVILQLLTAKPTVALTRMVQKALDNGCLMDILDSEAGKWPIEETLELALLGLSCTKLQLSDRPDLKTRVLPVLEKLKGVADRARDLPPSIQSSLPDHFICPILQDVMDDPFVAADGYTYDRKAIEIWLKMNDRSPMTNLPLPNKNLLPNCTLLSAIMEWKSQKQSHKPLQQSPQPLNSLFC